MENGFPQTIAKLRKNTFEEIWISLNEWNGKRLIDIRIYVRGLDGTQPTQKGVSLPVDLYGELRKALLQFERCLDSEQASAKFKKKANEEVRIARNEYKGHQLVNIRVFYSDKSGEMKATHKGVAFGINLFSEFQKAIAAIKQVLDK